MSVVNVTNIAVLDNPSVFTNPLQFEVTFECLRPLPEGKIIYFYIKCINKRPNIYTKEREKINKNIL